MLDKNASPTNHKNRLDKLISHDALIYEVLPHNLGIELYHKNDFIKLLSTPTSALKNIEFIESIKKQNKIVKLKFRIKA